MHGNHLRCFYITSFVALVGSCRSQNCWSAIDGITNSLYALQPFKPRTAAARCCTKYDSAAVQRQTLLRLFTEFCTPILLTDWTYVYKGVQMLSLTMMTRHGAWSTTMGVISCERLTVTKQCFEWVAADWRRPAGGWQRHCDVTSSHQRLSADRWRR